MRKGVGVWVGVVGVLCLVLVGLLVVVFVVRPGSSSAGGSPAVVVSSAGVESSAGVKSEEEVVARLLADKEYWGGFPPPTIVSRAFPDGDLFGYKWFIPEQVGGLPLDKNRTGSPNPGGGIFHYKDSEGNGLMLHVTRSTTGYKPIIEGPTRSGFHHVGQATCGNFNSGGDASCFIVALDSMFELSGNVGSDYSDVDLEKFLLEVIAQYREANGV